MVYRTKRCPRCDTSKHRNAFCLARKRGDGLAGICKECSREDRKKNGRRRRQNFRKLNPLAVMLKSARDRARTKGVAFNISADDLLPLPTVCPVLGIPINYDNHKLRDSSPSLDRIIPRLGYIPGNAKIISARANVLKNASSIEEVEQILRYMKSNLPEILCTNKALQFDKR